MYTVCIHCQRKVAAVVYDKQDVQTGCGLKGKTEMDALVAYLQVLGTSLKNKR